MTQAEVIHLCRYIRAACPAQAFDEFTADVWAEIIPADYTIGECHEAVIAIKQRQAFVDVSDIISQVKRTRRPAAAQAELRQLLDPVAYKAEVAAADDRFLRELAARTGRPVALKAIGGGRP